MSKFPFYLIFACAAFVLFFNGLVFFRNRNSRINRAFAVFGIFLFIWLFSYALAYFTQDKGLKLILFRVGYSGIIFMPASFFCFISYFLERQRDFVIRVSAYLMGIVFLVLHNTEYPLVVGLHAYPWGYYPNTITLIHPIFLVYLFGFFILANGLMVAYLIKKRIESNQIKYMRIKYVLFGSIVGNISVIDFLGNYGINFPPVGFIFIFIYPFIFSYAILKYRLMDIAIAITRTGIFIAVYSLVLGIPFALAFGWREQLKSLIGETWWLVPLISSTVLATVGPSIYFFIQKKAEDRLLQEQRRYQTTLRRASLGMGRVKDLKRLLKLTVNIVTRTVRIEHCEIYLSHKLSERYILKASQGWSLADDKRISFIPADAPLIQYLKRRREPLVYDEVKQRGQDFKDQVLEETGKIMEALDAALLVPSFIEEDLLAILVLGKKRSGKLYSHDDLIVFSILANQAALAIENAQFYEDMKKTHDQLMKAEKMATIGTMADGLSHQINNRLHAMGFIASDALDTIKLQPRESLPPEAKKVYEEMEVSLGKIQENVKRGGEIVEGLLKYSRKPDEGFAAIELGKLLDAALEMAQFKIKLSQIDIARNFNGAIPKIRGNFTQLQEVFFNMVDNSYDAMMQRKEEMKEPGYRGRLEISAQEEGNHLEIFIRDNGMGVKEKDFKRLFTPFFTTKLSSKKGTGLGLYVIRKIIEENHGGKVEFTSEYQKGSQTRLVLPIAT